MSVNPRGETPDVGVPVAVAEHMTVAEQHEWISGFLRRHVVSRRTALRGGAGALAALGLATAPWAQASRALAATAPVSVIGRHLSFGADACGQMAIGGELTAQPGAGDMVVDLGVDTRYGQRLPVEVRHLVSQVPQVDGSIRGAEQWFVHAHAAHLHPGATYHYRFRMPDGTVTPDATFRTAPPRGHRDPFVFTAFADQGVNVDAPDGQQGFSDNYYKPDDTLRTPAPSDTLIQRVAADRPAFHLLAGDICYADPSGYGRPVKSSGPADPPAGFDKFDPTVWTAYLGAIERSAASTPWMFATGNHDMEALYDDNRSPGGATHGYGGHRARLDLPGNGPKGCPSVYTFTHGTVGVVSVDANDLSAEIPTNAGYSGGEQLRWLERTLAGLRNDPGVDFVIAFFHHCAFATSGSHASDAGVRAALAPLFDRYRVDLVVQGHNHQYERTNPIRNGRSTPAPDGATVHPARDGTTYVCVGSGGRPRYTWQPGETDRYRGRQGPDSGTTVTSFQAGPDGAKSPETVDWSQARYLGYAYLRCEVRPGRPGGTSRLRLRTITDLGTEIDRVDLVRDVPRHGSQAHPAGWTSHSSGLSVPGAVGV
ncbi:metallophosphoesterase [Pseudonocardia endophytica]|uniref:Calcineurin-like phosphoesterase family protein n=1 Tax=Pseudonocardia endophytica TaxID=401976 RepID=A0A4R1I402_PSEEN|nr:metallophosphoesterase [Pseudonocardia endophytica]TCK24742.1 calcineurin-like phosphoesterase family protein [Pseudonocardia endophytica]